MFEDIQLASLADAMNEGLFVVDRHRNIVLWNRAAERLAGYRSEEIVGRQCHDGLLVHVDGHGNALCDRACPVAMCGADGGIHRTTAYLRHRDGHRLPMHVRTVPVRRTDGHVLGIAQLFDDAWDRTSRFELFASLRRLSMVDQLTRLPNRRYLLKALTGCADTFRLYGWRFGVLLVGLDGDCERIDPTGEARLEQLLRMTGATLCACVGTRDAVGRWGRREFLVVAEHTDVAQLADLGERLRALVASSFTSSSRGLLMTTVSIGGTISRPGDEGEELLRRVASCLRSSRRSGGDSVMVDLGESAPPAERGASLAAGGASGAA
ncbi:MAG: diguanylate cyclase [Myxococcota bacterium]|jgi:diguanylate cyclase (GGDEF)-like protein/PAS domain S-box-containing protein|nr:diguanylate cyclase [Myxococcota bacterium]